MSEFSPKELATVLAALRFWQRSVKGTTPRIIEGYEHFIVSEQTPLEDHEIDNLCERLNFGEEYDCKSESTSDSHSS
jgi:hypothetical protein